MAREEMVVKAKDPEERTNYAIKAFYNLFKVNESLKLLYTDGG